MLGGGIAQVIRQQGVNHHPLEHQPMAHQHQSVVLGVLQGFGVLAAAQPGGELQQHRFQRQLAARRGVSIEGKLARGAVSDGDVGHRIMLLAPAHADAHQLGAEGVEVGGFGVNGHRCSAVGAAQQPLRQLLQGARLLDQLGLQFRSLAVAGLRRLIRWHSGGPGGG